MLHPGQFRLDNALHSRIEVHGVDDLHILAHCEQGKSGADWSNPPSKFSRLWPVTKMIRRSGSRRSNRLRCCSAKAVFSARISRTCSNELMTVLPVT